MPFITQSALPLHSKCNSTSLESLGSKDLLLPYIQEGFGGVAEQDLTRLLKLCLMGAEHSPEMLFPDGDQTRSCKEEGVSKTPRMLFMERGKRGLFEVLILSERSVFSKCIYWNLYSPTDSIRRQRLWQVMCWWRQGLMTMINSLPTGLSDTNPFHHKHSGKEPFV